MAWGGQCVRYANDYFGTTVYGNACDWYNSSQVTQLDGIESDCVACWSGGSHGYGHVGVVETYDPDTKTMTYSDSNYRGDEEIIVREGITERQMKNLFGSSYKFQGYVRPKK